MGGRDAGFNLGVIGPYPPLLMEAVHTAGNAVLDALRPWARGGTLINFQGFATSPEAVGRAWDRATLARLRAVKRDWDPDSLFSFGYSMD